jgi:hypothetical protein
MTNWRKVDELWESFSASNSLTLSKKERRYLHGYTQYYSCTETYLDKEILYEHRFEKPAGVRAEEFKIVVKCNKGFRGLSIKPNRLLKKLISGNKYQVNTDYKLNNHLKAGIEEVYNLYPFVELEAKGNEFVLRINDLPKSESSFNQLRNLVISMVENNEMK